MIVAKIQNLQTIKLVFDELLPNDLIQYMYIYWFLACLVKVKDPFKDPRFLWYDGCNCCWALIIYFAYIGKHLKATTSNMLLLIQFTFDRVQISTAGQRSVRLITHYGRLEISDIILSNYLPYYTYHIGGNGL